MPSYFIDRRAQSDGSHAVHARNRCPPQCFPPDAEAEYLGELLDGAQAVTLARLIYADVRGCRCCDYAAARGVRCEEAGASYVSNDGVARILAAACASTPSPSLATSRPVPAC